MLAGRFFHNGPCAAMKVAAHESPRTTKLYDRTSDQVDLGEIEKIQI